MQGKNQHIVDAASLESLFREFYQPLCMAAYYILADEVTAEDIVQDFFYYIWKRRNELGAIKDFRHYSLRAIRNASYSYYKNSRRHAYDRSVDWDGIMQDDAAEKEALSTEEERNQRLWAAIDALPEQQRTVFLRVNRDDLSYMEIAEEMGLSINTVKTHMRLAYQTLREKCRWMILAWLIYFF